MFFENLREELREELKENILRGCILHKVYKPLYNQV